MSAWTYCLQDGKAAPKIVPPRLRIPCWKGLGADSEEKHEPASDIDTMAVDSLKALDPKRPIREADMASVKGRSRLRLGGRCLSYPSFERVTEVGGQFINLLAEHRIDLRQVRAAEGEALAMMDVLDMWKNPTRRPTD